MRGNRLVIANKIAAKAFKKWNGFNPKNKKQPGRYKLTQYEIERFLGIYRKTRVPCSCYMCGNPRRHWGYITIKDARQMLDVIDQFAEVGLVVRKPRYLKGWLD